MEENKNILQSSGSFLNNSLSTTGSDIFVKTESTKPVVVGGHGALVLFKLPHKKSKSVSKIQIQENNFVTDGGLMEKKMKYYNSTKFNKPNKRLSQTSQPDETKTKSEDAKELKPYIPPKKKHKKVIDEEKLQKEKIQQNLKNLKSSIGASLTRSISKKQKEKEEEKKNQNEKTSKRSFKVSNQNSEELQHKNRRDHSHNLKQEDSKDSEKEDRPKRNNFLSSSKEQASNTKQKSPNESVSKILSEKERIELMEQLVKNKEEEIIREVQKEVLKKGKQTNDKIQKKLKYLNERGLLENIDFEADTAQMSGTEEQNVVISRITRRTSNNIPQVQVRSHSNQTENTVLKPKVDSLEYLARIYHERNENILERNSFRQSHSHSRLNQTPRKEINDEDDNFKFTYKKNNRKPEEIYQFIIQKKQEEKLKAVKIENEENARNIQILVELAKLNEKIQRRRKVKNTHYIGSCKNFSIPNKNNKEHHLDPDESTIVDPNEYYYALLESKQILSPKDQVPISSRSKEEFLQFINDQEENILKNSGKLGNSDIDKFLELKSRALNTINRANQILENTNIESLLNKKENEHSINHSLESIPSLHSSIKVPSSLDGVNKLNEAFDYFGQIIQAVVLKYSMRKIRSAAESNVLQDEINDEEILHRYSIGFQYLTAIIKKTPFENLINHVNKLSYLDVLNALFAPIKRRAFYNIGLYGDMKLRTSHFANILECIIKRNVMERIYLKANYELIANEQEELNDQEHLNESDMYQKELEEQLEREEERYKNNIEDNQDIELENSNEEETREEYYQIFKQIFKKLAQPHLKEAFEIILSFNFSRRNVNRSNNVSLRSSSVKYNTFLHETSSEKSFILYPNSFDSHRLHRIHMLIERQRMEAGGDDEEIHSEQNDRTLNHSQRSHSNNNYDIEMDMSMSNSRSRRSDRQSRSSNDRRYNYSDGEMNKSQNSLKVPKTKSKDITNSHEKETSKKEHLDSVEENQPGKNISQHSIPLSNSIEFNLKENKQVLTEEGKNNVRDISLEENKSNPFHNIRPEEISSSRLVKEEPRINVDMNEYTLRNKFNNVMESGPSDFEASANDRAISEQDISADRDLTSDIDWGHTISQSKSSGSQRDFQFPNNKEGSATKPAPNIIDEEQSASEDKKSVQLIDDGANYDFGFVEDIPDTEDNNNISELIKIDQTDNKPETYYQDKLQPPEEKHKEDSQLNENPELYMEKENLIPSSCIKSLESDGEDYFKISNTKLSNENVLSHNKRYDNTEEENELHIDNYKQIDHEEQVDELEEEEKPQLVIPNIEELADEITDEILKSSLYTEILDREVVLIPKKSKFLDIPVSPNTSTTSIASKSSSTIFTKPVHEQKKEISLNLYNNKIAGNLITKITSDLNTNFESVYQKLKTPMTYDPHLLLFGIITKNTKLLRQGYRNIECPAFFDKHRILTEFQKTNKEIRESDNLTSDNYYDNILNECMIDAANEILFKERLYGDLGEPLPGSSRTRIIKYKYTSQSGPKMCEMLRKELTNMTNYKMGLIADNHEHLDPDQLNVEREKKLMENIAHELKEADEAWRNFEVEETQVKMELAELVLEQLLNETVEILEHVQLSRRKPSLYQMKSIYACEDIPRLSFQQYHTENGYDSINQ